MYICFTVTIFLQYHDLLSTACNIFWFKVMPRRQHSGTEDTSTKCTDCTFPWGKDTILYCMYSMTRQHSGTNYINCTVSPLWIRKQRNAVYRRQSSQTMLEGVYGWFMTCNVFLAGNSEVSLELQYFTAELITYIVCECDAPEWYRSTLLGMYWKQACCTDCRRRPFPIKLHQ